MTGAPSLLLLASLALGGAGPPGDYRVDSTAWNGLSMLAQAGRDAGCPVEATTDLAWDELSGSDVLWLVYPTGATLSAEHLVAFLEAGGRVVIADDFGTSGAALERLGLQRVSASLERARSWNGNPHLLVAASTGQGRLAGAGARIITNHPSAFATRLPAAYQLAAGAAIVVEGNVGRGRFVALSDPSVLINNMQELTENRGFAAALLAETCRPGVDRIRLVSGPFVERGTPPASLRGAPPGDHQSTRLLDRINALLDSLGDGAPARTSRWLAGLAFVALALLLLARALPTQLPSLGGGWTRAPAAPGVGYSALVTRYAAGELPWGHTFLAAVLRDELVLRLTAALGGQRSLGGMRPRDLGALVSEHCGTPAGRLAERLWRDLGRVPAQGYPASAVSARRIRQLHSDATELFDLLAPTKDRA